MSDYIQVPLQSLRDIANNLAGMKADLEGDKKGADLLSGVDSCLLYTSPSPRD